MSDNKIDGWLFIDKPIGISSFSVIRKIRKKLNTKKIGHAGTLDPFATGVLGIAIGEATKSIDYLNDKKEYEFMKCISLINFRVSLKSSSVSPG